MLTLKNSRGGIFEIDPIDLVEKVNKEGIDHSFIPPEILPDDPKEGDWAEYFSVPTCNGIYNPETGQDEFCIPFWMGDLTEVKIGRVKFSSKERVWNFNYASKRPAFPDD